MTARLPIEEAVLTREQWRQVEALGRSLTPVQARWISDYFAALDDGSSPEGEDAAAFAPASGRTLTILYGTETGNSREVAAALALAARERGLTATLSDLANYKVRALKDAQDVACIVSTYGEGDPPQSSLGFFEFLEGSRAPRLGGLRFSVLALGDSTYEKYCEAGKRIDRRFAELGATRLSERADCDVDYEDRAALWSQSLLDTLLAGIDDSMARAQAAIRSAATQPQARVRAHDKHHPFLASVLDSLRIVGRHSTKDTRHVELDVSGSGMTYRPGDALGVVANNDPSVVEHLLVATGLAADAPVQVKGETLPLAEALTRKFEITTVSPRFVDHWAHVSGAAELIRLAESDASMERRTFCERHHVIDVLRRFPVPGIDAQRLVAGLRPLQPRLYSIASSQAAVGDEVHLTVAPVRYGLHGSERGGVASTHIADRLDAGATIPVYVQENAHFRLPADDVPIVMIGPGTGVAPFRAFVQEREARAARGRSWLFFGERHRRSDFLYQTEWQAWLKAGVLTRLDVAFSRDTGAKTYVQHRMLEHAQDLYAWLEEGAHVYVCGDAAAMASDVHEALVGVIEKQGALARDAAEDYVRRLAADHRYQRDVY
jgi:sulfite reductase (NADPH) flavoprotein alpha-component